MDNPYLIWSHEHSAWWRAGSGGYTRKLSEAGHYSRESALAICAKAIPGTANRMGALPELPVRLEDLDIVIATTVGETRKPLGGDWL